jgi:RNA polymerase sigma factor (TIGR02999 family)
MYTLIPEAVTESSVMNSSGDVTRLLSAWTSGDKQALDELMPLVYSELHRIAQNRWIGQHPGHTLQPTALIHEAYLKLVHQGPKTYESRSHFFAVASMAMRHVLVNHAEASLAGKRSGRECSVSLDEVQSSLQREAREVLALHEALRSLEEIDPRKCRIVELRYFGGLSIAETAEALDISTVTVNREWRMARAWLARELGAGKNSQL